MSKLVKDLPWEIYNLYEYECIKQARIPEGNRKVTYSTGRVGMVFRNSLQGFEFWNRIVEGKDYYVYTHEYPFRKNRKDLRQGNYYVAISHQLSDGEVFKNAVLFKFEKIGFNNRLFGKGLDRKGILFEEGDSFCSGVEYFRDATPKERSMLELAITGSTKSDVLTMLNKGRENFVVSVENEEQAMDLMKWSEQAGFTWYGGSLDNFLDGPRYYVGMTYCFDKNLKKISHARLAWFEEVWPDSIIYSLEEFYSIINHKSKFNENSKTIISSVSRGKRERRISVSLGGCGNGLKTSRRSRKARSCQIGARKRSEGNGLCPRRRTQRVVTI